MNGCTIIARNYLAFARVLALSFLEHHPDSQFTVLVIDDIDHSVQDCTEPFRVLHLEDLGVPLADLHRMAMIYEVTEFATALKPTLLLQLLRAGADHVVYLDPDIEIFSGFPEVADLARQHGIVLTPHVLQPMPRDGLFPGEQQILVAGMFNLGFIGVGERAKEFLSWWAERLSRDAVVDPCNGLFTDQRWVDFVPALFDHHVIRDPSFNVAYWNVFQRPLSHCDNEYQVVGTPLRFFHFSGFDPRKPQLLSKHQAGLPRTLLSEHPIVAELCRTYASKLWAQGHDDVRVLHYGFRTLPNGWRIDVQMRRVYREALHLKDGIEDLPRPFDPGGVADLVEWLIEPAVIDGMKIPVSRYLVAHWKSRLDLQREFPRLVGESVRRFKEWAETDESFAREVPFALRTTKTSPKPHSARFVLEDIAAADALVPGVNIVGYFQAELGVGQAGRLIIAGLEETGIPFASATYDRTLSSQHHPFQEHDARHAFDVNIFCINADQTATFIQEVGQAVRSRRYNIGVWFWEVEKFPAAMHEAFDYVDEVWVASEFTQRAIAAETAKPVNVVPLPIVVSGYPTRFTRADFQLSSDYLFFFCFDVFSVVERKNPLAVIEAFRQAFEPGEGASLLVKTMNGGRRVDALEELRLAAASHPDIQIVDRCLPPAQISALTQLADCTVSLHRSEGFGLTLAEAMARAKPVIATGYSGNLTFMDENNSYLVPYELSPIGPGLDPYPAASRWAEPNVVAAAGLMREVFDDQEAAAVRGQLGYSTIRERHDVSRTASFISSRLKDIRRSHGLSVHGEVRQ